MINSSRNHTSQIAALRPVAFSMILVLIAQCSLQPAFSSDASLESMTVLILGDSLAAGHGLDPNQSFPALLQEKIRKENLPFNVVNAGVSGDTSSGGLRRMDWLLRRKIDVLILELGGNDGLRGIPPETTRSNLQAVIDRATERYPEVQVIVAGMKMPPNMGPDYGEEFEAIFPKLAERNKAQLIPFLLEGVGGNPGLNQSDRIHPNAEGQKIVAENVWKVLGPVLEEVTKSDDAPAKSVKAKGQP